MRTNELEKTETTTLPSAPPAPLQWGQVQFLPHLLYRFSYGDGIPASPGRQYTTAINELSPGLRLRLGSRWTVDYTPTLRYYSNNHFQDGVDHYVMFGGGTAYGDWTFGLSQGYSISTQPLIETGSQTETETFTTTLDATRQLNSKLSLELGANQSLRFLGGDDPARRLSDSISWSTLDWLNYQYSQAFGVALGAGFGYDMIETGSDMTSEQVQGRIQWRPGEKLNLVVHGGAEVRQFLDSNSPDAVSPVYGATIRYQLFESTALSANLNRSVSPSYYLAQITDVTALSGSLRQRFFGKLYLDVTGGYSRSSYQYTFLLGALLPSREDDQTYINIRLSLPFLKRGSLAAFFQASDNASNANLYTTTSRQGGFELGYRF